MTTTTEKIPAAILGPPEERCGECSTVLATDQRYCLNCGLRRGAPRVDVLAQSELLSGQAAPRRKRLAVSRATAAVALTVAAIAGVAIGTAIDGGSSSGQPSSNVAPKPGESSGAAAGDPETDAAAAQKKSESLPDSVVTP